MDYQEDVAKYRKKSQKKTPRKSKHKHDYQPCVLQYERAEFDKVHGFTPTGIEERVGSYCPICGKIGEVDFIRWWFTAWNQEHSTCWSEPTEEAKRELNPETRTLPTFWAGDMFAKYVDIE